MIKIAIYTAIFGERDILRDPLNFSKKDNIDYFCFSDRLSNVSDIYKYVIKKPFFKNDSVNARYYKILGDTILDGYDFIIWHDGNIQIDISKVEDLIDYSSGFFLSTFKHPHRNCFYDESCICIKRNKENPFKILKQVCRYYYLELPSNIGLFETGIMVKNNAFNENYFYLKWWDHILKNSKRDQLSLSFLNWSEGKKLGMLPGSGTNNKFSNYFPHTRDDRKTSWNKFIKYLVIKTIYIIKPRTIFN